MLYDAPATWESGSPKKNKMGNLITAGRIYETKEAKVGPDRILVATFDI